MEESRKAEAMGKIEKTSGNISVIGGSDGLTSIFIAGGRKRTLRQRLQKRYFAIKKKWCALGIKPGTHTMEEVVSFIKEAYGFEEVPKDSGKYMREYDSLRSSFIMQYEPELLGEYAKPPKLQSRDEEGIKAFQKQLELREQKAKEIPTEQFAIDLYILEKTDGENQMDFILESRFGYIGGGFSGSGKGYKHRYHEIYQQVHRYYGVTEDDIANNTKRYQELVTVLAHRN